MKYPLGIQTFSEVREENYLYIDKTEFIYQLVSRGKIYFLSRPRRFGKSLLVSTFESLFNGERVLFDGLFIGSSDYEFKPFPVLSLEFAKEEFATADNLRDFIYHQVEYFAETFGITLTRSTYVQRFDELITKIHHTTGKKVVLLIDEYDKPILNNLDKDTLAEVKQVITAFYAAIKALDKHLRFVFITGVSKFAKVSVFSGMNSMTDISFNARYANICGVNEHELLSYFADGIEQVVVKEQSDKTKMLAEIKRWYNGYLFEESVQRVYNPYSLLCLFEQLKFNNYWYETGTPTFLIQLIKNKQFNLADIAGYRVDSSIFMSVEPEQISPVIALLQTGYLTIDKCEEGFFSFKFPNFEVEYAFNRSIVEQFSFTPQGTSLFSISKLIKAINSNDLDSFFDVLSVFFANIPYDITLAKEKYYQSLFYSIFTLLGFQIDTEVRTDRGRVDCVLQTSSHIYLVEFKLDGTKEQALEQIHKNDYAGKYKLASKELVLAGVEFDADIRNIGGYLVDG